MPDRRYMLTVEGLAEAEDQCRFYLNKTPRGTIVEAWDDETDKPVASIELSLTNRFINHGLFVRMEPQL
jgi:hypothetical protein